MTTFLIDNPLFLLFLVAAIGYLVGRIRIGSFSLGVSAVLFVGLAFGALDPGIGMPEIVYQFGLILFVYTVGLAGGPGFVAAMRRDGLRENLFVVAMLTGAAGLVVVAHHLLDLRPGLSAGLYAGSLTNTPALATVLESVTTSTPAAELDAALADPVVGYSVAYPIGVLGVILAIAFVTRRWDAHSPQQRHELQELGVMAEEIQDVTITVTRDLGQLPVAELSDRLHGVLLARQRRERHQWLVRGHDVLAPGDQVSVVGPPQAVAEAVALLGEVSQDQLMQRDSELDYRRIFVSNPEAVGLPISELDLAGRFNATVTRVRHGDMDRLARGDMKLELGDRVRVVAPRDRMGEVSRWFGDSTKALSEIDIGVFGLGIALGLLLGSVPIPLPGGASFSLGLAGGPLVVGLVLGALRRTGPIVWQLPYNANLTLRQTGLILFLAGVGTSSGYGFVTTVGDGGLPVFAAGAVITFATALATLMVGRHLLHIPVDVLTGMVSGVHTGPAGLAFANDLADNEAPDLGYATVFPVATITKILLAQLLLVTLS